MKKVLIIDDEAENIGVLSDMLVQHFEVIPANSGRQGIVEAVRHEPDLILLDVNMPEMNGYDVCKRLREQPSTRHIPIVMLTSLSAVDNRVKGLDLGADDYICKPFHARELVARISARIRRQDDDKQREDEIQIGNLQLNPKACEVRIDGELIPLTQMEFDLLRYFLEHPNRVIPRNKLLGDLWPDAVVTDRTVDTHVANLRKKIRNFNCSLGTVYRAGYILKIA